MSRIETMPGRHVYFDVWQPDLRKFVQRKYKARVFLYQGVSFSLFQTRVLCACIGRHVQTIRNWEKAGKFPKPVFNVQLTGDYERDIQRRWYSDHQIRTVQRLALQYWGDDLTAAKGKNNIDYDAFFQAVKRAWLSEFAT